VKVLVTGGAGFIGSHVCDRLLAEGHAVVAVDDLSTGRIANLGECRGYGKEFQFQNLDIRSDALPPLFARAEPEVVIHLAAQAGVRPSVDDPLKDASINVMGLINVLESSAASGVSKVIFASSGGTIYGEPRKLPVKETGAAGAKPVSPYGITKKVAEDYLRFYQRYRGLDYTALALANVYGPRQDPHGEAGVVAIFARAMLAGTPPVIFGDGNQTRDFVFIDDTSHAFSLALERGAGKLINIGTALETSVSAIAQLLSEITGFKEAPQKGPKKQGELRRIALDNALAADELAWRPWTHLEDGLAETVAYLRETG
jgi:UDP-glucose 4-epimerase